MATFTRSQKLLISAGVGAFGGAAALILLAGNVVTIAGAGATAADASSPLSDQDFPVCATTAARARRTCCFAWRKPKCRALR